MKTRNPLWSLALTILTLSLIVPAVLAADDSAEHTKRGVELAKKKQYAEAAEEFGLAIKADPKDSKHYLNRANALKAAGKLDDAAKDFEKYSQLAPGHAEGVSGLGKIKVAQKDYDGAITELTKAIGMDGDDIENYRFRAFAYLGKNEYEKAIADYSKVLEAKPNDTQALERRGFAYRSLKQYDKAVEDFSKLVKANPKDPEAYRRRGYAHSLAGENEKALEDYRKVLELKPGDADAQLRVKAVESRKPAMSASPGAGASPAPPSRAPVPAASPQ